ncbi:MAG TPA: hypothetical protein V6C89_21705 [Drouetiella sp.]
MKSAHEPRWPASAAVLVAICLHLALPKQYIWGPFWLMPLMELAILLPLSMRAPHRVPHEGRLNQFLAFALIIVVNIANFASLILLILMLLYNGKSVTGPELLFSSLGIWITNVIVFALWYWELDSGGPDERMFHAGHCLPDFLFPQMATAGVAANDWRPQFIDYIYVAFTNATAFSPTDTMPLTVKAKILMLCQSAISIITVTLVAARAVNILS